MMPTRRWRRSGNPEPAFRSAATFSLSISSPIYSPFHSLAVMTPFPRPSPSSSLLFAPLYPTARTKMAESKESSPTSSNDYHFSSHSLLYHPVTASSLAHHPPAHSIPSHQTFGSSSNMPLGSPFSFDEETSAHPLDIERQYFSARTNDLVSSSSFLDMDPSPQVATLDLSPDMRPRPDMSVRQTIAARSNIPFRGKLTTISLPVLPSRVSMVGYSGK
jgi:hypothetical protein